MSKILVWIDLVIKSILQVTNTFTSTVSNLTSYGTKVPMYLWIVFALVLGYFNTFSYKKTVNKKTVKSK